MPAELMEAPALRDGAYAEAGQGGGIPPPPAWGPRRPPRRGSRGSPQGSRRRARPSGEGARGPDLPLERGRALGEPYPEHTGCPFGAAPGGCSGGRPPVPGQPQGRWRGKGSNRRTGAAGDGGGLI